MLHFCICSFRLKDSVKGFFSLFVKAKLLIAYGLIQQFHEPDQANRGEMAEKVGKRPSFRGRPRAETKENAGYFSLSLHERAAARGPHVHGYAGRCLRAFQADAGLQRALAVGLALDWAAVAGRERARGEGRRGVHTRFTGSRRRARGGA